MIKDLFKGEAGFTLLELIVVVAVIGILAAIIVPQVSNIQDDAQENSVRSSLANMQTSLEQYKLGDGDGSYPEDEDAVRNDLGIDLTDYSYATDDDDDQYVLVYDQDSDASVSITGGTANISGLDAADKIGSGSSPLFITSESSNILTTN